MARRPVELTPRAQRQITAARKWWLANREKAPTAFDDDLDEMLELLARNPGIGASTPSKRVKDLRRVLLARSNHYLFYKTVEDDPTVYILNLWFAGRGRMPAL